MAKGDSRSSDVNLKNLVRGQDEWNHAQGLLRTELRFEMSPIEKLKAEAVALREKEMSAGRAIQHCEALERVAKNHGYASWRACAASLGNVKSTNADGASEEPAAQMETSSEFRPSRLLDGDLETARQSAFTSWMASGLMQAAVDFSRNIGLLPIYAETSVQGTRYLFWHSPAGALCEVRSGRVKEAFMEFDQKNRDHGRRLISLHVGSDHRYSAVWISAEHHASAVQFLNRFGISPAEHLGGT
jgi:hypothetical protein